MSKREMLARGVMGLSMEKRQLEKEASDLRSRLEMFEKRARAEAILLNARESNAPSGIRPVTIDDFLAKRAKLENSADDHLEKVAMFVEFCNDTDDFMVSDEGDASGGDYTEWLESIT